VYKLCDENNIPTPRHVFCNRGEDLAGSLMEGMVHTEDFPKSWPSSELEEYEDYIVVDGQQAWVGTSNVSRDYFHSSRNVGLLIEGAPFAAVLDQHFALSWGSAYAEEVDPKGSYTPPKRKNK
jgi:hypothetical protein